MSDPLHLGPLRYNMSTCPVWYETDLLTNDPGDVTDPDPGDEGPEGVNSFTWVTAAQRAAARASAMAILTTTGDPVLVGSEFTRTGEVNMPNSNIKVVDVDMDVRNCFSISQPLGRPTASPCPACSLAHPEVDGIESRPRREIWT